MTQFTADPALVRSTPATPWRSWLILWIPVALCLAALLAFDARLDTFLYCSIRWFFGDGQYYKWADYKLAHAADQNPAFYMITAPPLASRLYARTDRLWQVFKDFGEFWTTLIILFLIAIYHPRKWAAALGALAATSLAGALGWLIRTLDGRFRPTHTDGTNTWEFLRGFHNGTDLSFPSGHATLAFATAAVLTYLSPKGRPLFLTIATGTALSRVVMQAHFPSDAIFGSALGWTIGWLVIQFGDSLYQKLSLRKNTPSGNPRIT